MKKNKKLILGLLMVALLLVVGVTYAFFTYENGTRSEIVTGQIYLNYTEKNKITLTNAWPETKETAMQRTDNVFNFTIEGQNTSKEDIFYTIKINYANDIEEKLRIAAKHVKIYLESDGEILVDGVNYYAWNDQKIAVATIPAGTTERITKNYSLRMWIDENVTISDTDPNADYTTSEWNNIYANLIVNVYGEAGNVTFVNTGVLSEAIEEEYATYLTETDDNGTRFISGTSSDIVNNYVYFSDMLWRIVGINSDGSLKLITEDSVTEMAWDSTGNTDYSTSEIRTWLNNDFYSTLNQDLISEGTWDYSEMTSSYEKVEVKTLTDKVGLLNAFEFLNIISSVGNFITVYLVNGGDTWLMTKTGDNVLAIFDTNIPAELNYVRPSINLISDAKFTNGDGSKNNPYRFDTSYGITTTDVSTIKTLSERVEVSIDLTEKDADGTKFVYGEEVNNYVWYSDRLWRIVSVNDDGSIKMITENSVAGVAWNSSGSTDYSNSTMRSWLNETFLPTLYNYQNILEESTWDYTTYSSFPTEKLETINSVNDMVGLLDIYEFMMTGGTSSKTTPFLDNGTWWWLLSPYVKDKYVNTIYFSNGGGHDYTSSERSTRPCVVLKKNIKITGGTGERINPYTIEGDDNEKPIVMLSGPKYSYWENSLIFNDNVDDYATMELICLDYDGFDEYEITVDDFEYDSDAIEITKLIRKKIDNGYKYIITINISSVAPEVFAGDATSTYVTLKEGVIVDKLGYANDATISLRGVTVKDGNRPE